MKSYIFVFLLFLSFSGYSQNSIDNYKFAVVPAKFAFLKQNDQYALNSLTKALLQDKGFIAYLDNELPVELADNKCSALTVEVLEKSGLLSTNLTLLLKDCQGKIVFKSKEGKSREKEYKVAYNLALRDAFTSLDKVSYSDPKPAGEPVQQVVPTTASELPAKSTSTAINQPVLPIVATTTSETPAKLTEPVKSTTPVDSQPAGTLYAQAIGNGYQLIDTTPKIVLTLLKTSAENYFIASSATVNGIVLKKKEDWVFEYYKDGKLISEKLLVKF